MFEMPDPDVLGNLNEISVADFPSLHPVEVSYDQPDVTDVDARTKEVLGEFTPLSDLEPGAEIGVTAGSRGIHDMPTMLRAAVDYLQSAGFEPFIFPAMGSHGGATAEGQAEMLASLGITEESMGCEIRSSMDVEPVGEGMDGRPVYASTDAMDADAVLLANRVKVHTDFQGDIESGLAKMSVVGLGKQRGTEKFHSAAIAYSYEECIRDRAAILFEETPILGGLALIENARDRAAHIEAISVEDIFEREEELLEWSRDLLPTIPVDDLDILIIDEVGKNVSGTGMDTNVIGRIHVYGEEEPSTPDVTRIYVRSLTEEAHGNAVGIGLADFVHQRATEDIELTDTYVNTITAGCPERARIPMVVPDDRLALQLLAGTTGVRDPGDLRIVRIQNTMEVDEIEVSTAVAEELRDDPTATVGDPKPIEFEGDDLESPHYE
ncbi:MAG: DUF362 domain-containing protein [Halodesulfurarchaeum sp.]